MSRHAGYALLEFTVGLVMAGVITSIGPRSVEATDLSQSELLRSQAELAEARTTLRGASALPLSGVMETAAAKAALSAISDTSFTIRAFQAAGTVCSVMTDNSVTRFGIQEVRGAFPGGLSLSDSVMVYDVSANHWRTARLAGFWTGAAAWEAAPFGGGTPVCFSGESSAAEPRPQASLELDASPLVLDRIKVGAPVRAFRSTEYGVFQWEGDWWLGERVDGASGWKLLTGPLFPPGPGGIEISYYKADGTTATDGSTVASVELLLWIKGDPQHRNPSSKGRPFQDHMRIRVDLQNGGAW
ncbi:hypothetical protein ACFL3S_04975 [Gemmatimonadota bacterium]